MLASLTDPRLEPTVSESSQQPIAKPGKLEFMVLRIVFLKERILRKLLEVLLTPVSRLLGFTKRIEAGQLPQSSYYVDETASEAIIRLHDGYLQESGWIESKITKKPRRSGRYIPWISYPALAVLERIDLRDRKVLEFGSGASSIFFC